MRLVILVGILVGCGDVGQKLSEVLCERMDECDNAFWGDAGECDDYFGRDMSDCELDKGQASGCLDEIEGADCDEINSGEWFDDCDEVYDCDGDEVGVGGVTNGNATVLACEAMVEAISCGETDYSADYGCSAYSEVQCDLSDYFICIGEAYTCEDGVPGIDAEMLSTCTISSC